MGKPTPGPWHVAYDDKHGQAVVSGEHTEIATCWHHSVGSIEKQMRANATLIAAAPDLLAACEALITYDERPDDGPNAGIQMMVDYDHALTLARAAVARALPNPDTEGATS